MQATGQRASRLETLGAWLRVWTPPRDVRVPEPPSRRALALGALGVLAVAAVVYFAVAPVIDKGKDERAAREARIESARSAANAARLRTEQRPRFGDVAGDRPAALAAIGAAIGADARKRFDPDAQSATCTAAPRQDPAAARLAFNCFAPVREIRGGGEQAGVRGHLGVPYRAVVDFGAGRYAFCKVNPPPGEQALRNPKDVVRVPGACRG